MKVTRSSVSERFDDVVRIAGNHLHDLHPPAAYLEADNLLRTYLAELYQTVPAHHHKLLVLAMVPVLGLS
mgnify:CR=1 FL=1